MNLIKEKYKLFLTKKIILIFHLKKKKKKKDNSKVYRDTEYKNLNKCESFITLKDKKEILKYESLYLIILKKKLMHLH